MVELNSNEIKARMDKAISSLKKDLSGLRVGRASSSMLDQINVNAYGNSMPINQVGTISVPEARLLIVNVWDSSIVANTETKATLNTVMSNSFGFGGTNATLIFEKV